MNFLPSLATWQFAVAGAVAAAAPIILHLLNRRRYRVLEWAAMQFLREALQRRRRIMEIRDLLLMLLRAAAVLLFGLALARPFFAASQEQLDAGQPVHAVLLIDNSLSMAYQTLEGSRLDRAIQRATAFLERVPAGSRISVIPLCGSVSGQAVEPFDTKPFAREALQRIAVVDRATSVRQAVNEAKRAAERVPDLAPRYVLFTDPQRGNWNDLAALGTTSELPSMQVVDVSDDNWENTWVADLRVPDGVADPQTPTNIEVVLRHHGREGRRDVRAALWVRDQEVDSQMVSFDTPDATREITFEYTLRDVHPEPARPEFVPIKVVLAPDRLVEDDERHLLVPVVAAFPVVFVDQYGEEEDPARNRLGETRHLRQLLAPTTLRDSERQLIQIRHVQLAELDRDLLADARLVVIAGVADPAEKVELLREYVEQGGQLVLAAGAEFDPVAWNSAAWQDGQGILPLPLQPELLGALPDVAGRDWKPFFLSYESLRQHPSFVLAGNSEEDLRDLYAEPFFFQIVQVETADAAMDAASRAGSMPEDSPPHWLTWVPPEAESPEEGTGKPAGAGLDAAAARPRVLARFTSETGPPFLVERQIGRGRVLFASSGLQSSWNTLPKTNAIVIFDRLLRSAMQATLPVRNYPVRERIPLPLPLDARDHQILLFRPGRGAMSESVDTGFLRTDQLGVTIEQPLSRGIYRLQAASAADPASASGAHWKMAVAVNGSEAESDLAPIDSQRFAEQAASASFRWVGSREEISLAGGQIRGQDLWWWLALAVFLLLLLESLVILWPMLADSWRPPVPSNP